MTVTDNGTGPVTEVRVEYRVMWDMPDPWFIAEYEALHGQDSWSKLGPEAWEGLPWRTTVHTTMVRAADGISDSPGKPSREDLLGQAKQLQNWAESHDQPVRNVIIESREIPSGQPWTPVVIPS